MSFRRLYAKSRRYQPQQAGPSIIINDTPLVRQPSRTEVDLDALAADIDGSTAANVGSREHDGFQTSYTMVN